MRKGYAWWMDKGGSGEENKDLQENSTGKCARSSARSTESKALMKQLAMEN